MNGNKLAATYIAAYLLGSTGNTLVQSNTISNSVYAIADLSSGGGNLVTRNTVNEAYYGVYTVGPIGDTLTPNSFFNVVVTVDPNPFTDPGGTNPD